MEMMIYKWYIVKVEYSPKDYKGNGTVATLTFDHIFRNIRDSVNLTRAQFKAYRMHPRREVKRHYEYIQKRHKDTPIVVKEERVKMMEEFRPTAPWNDRDAFGGLGYGRGKLLKKCGLGFAEFEVWVDDLTDLKGNLLSAYTKEGMEGQTVILNGVDCRVQRHPLKKMGRWIVTLVLITNVPNSYVNYSL